MNFGRVVRMAIRYKFTFAATIVSALMVAVLWGAKSAPSTRSSRSSSRTSRCSNGSTRRSKRTDDHRGEVGRLGQLRRSWPPPKRRRCRGSAEDPEGHPRRRGRIAETNCRILWALQARQAVRRRSTCPHDPFHTLVLITAVAGGGTVVKDVFLVANNVLVARLAQLAMFDLRKLFYRRTLRMDLATFGEDGTADLMSRFTNDMNQVAGGLDSLFGKLIREPLKMFACLVAGGVLQLAAVVATLIITPVAAFSDSLAGKDAQAGQSPGDGGNGRHLHDPRRNLPQHQDRQGIHQRIAGTQAVPRQQQALLPQGPCASPATIRSAIR